MSINQVSLHQFNFLNFILLQFNSVLNELYTDGIWDFFRQQVFIFSFKLLVSLMNFWTDISQFLPESKNKKKHYKFEVQTAFVKITIFFQLLCQLQSFTDFYRVCVIVLCKTISTVREHYRGLRLICLQFVSIS